MSLFVAAIPQGEDCWDATPYLVTGRVSPSADGSEWDVVLVSVALGGELLPLSSLTEEQQERAKDRLAEIAHRADQMSHARN